MKSDNKPIWYEVYQAFPPKYPPKYDRPIPNVEIPKIFYQEDIVRSKIHKSKSGIVGSVNLTDKRESNTQKCIAYYEEMILDGLQEQEALNKAIEKVASEIPSRREKPIETTGTTSSLVEEFKRSKALNLKEILKE